MSDLDFLKANNPEAKLVLLIARQIVYKQDEPEIKDLLMQGHIEWNKFNKLLSRHELFTFSYLYLKNYPYLLPPEEIGILEKSYYYSIKYTSYLWEEFMRIADIFNKEGVEFLPLKGIAFIVDNVYSNRAYLRPIADIDILVQEEDFSLAEATLGTLGYEKALLGFKEAYWKEKGYHLVFERKENKLNYFIEVHWALDYKRYEPLLPHLWNRIHKCQKEGKYFYVLSPEDTLFSIALHQRRFGSRPLALKDVCDAAMLLKRYNTEFDWDYVLKETKAGNIKTTLYFILIQANLLLNVRIPSFVLTDLSVSSYKERLIQQFILQNTFSFNRKADSSREVNNIYLKSHFLLYDTFLEPVKYILNIPQEQFAKFYGLSPYAIRTIILYRLRYIYFMIDAILMIVTVVIKKTSIIFRNIHNFLCHL